jgi:tellurite resistance protein
LIDFHHRSSSVPETRISPQAALIYTMVLAAAADGEMTDRELRAIEEMIVFLPAFRSFEISSIAAIAAGCTDLLGKENGLDIAFRRIKHALPPGRLRETAYALACDVVAADGTAGQEELQFLELLRHAIDVGRLPAAAIERAARARFAPIDGAH